MSYIDTDNYGYSERDLEQNWAAEYAKIVTNELEEKHDEDVAELEAEISGIASDLETGLAAVRSELEAELYDDKVYLEGAIEAVSSDVSYLDNWVRNDISDLTVGVNNINSGLADGTKIGNGTITSAKIGTGEVKTVNIDAGAVGTDQLARYAVTPGKINAEAVTTEKIKDGAVTTAKLDGGAVTSAKIGTGEVKTVNIDAGAVGTDQLAHHSITPGKIDDGAVATSKIADGAVTTAKLASDALALYNYNTAAPVKIGTWTHDDVTSDIYRKAFEIDYEDLDDTTIGYSDIGLSVQSGETVVLFDRKCVLKIKSDSGSHSGYVIPYGTPGGFVTLIVFDFSDLSTDILNELAADGGVFYGYIDYIYVPASS